jgi:hypothetical protein
MVLPDDLEQRRRPQPVRERAVDVGSGRCRGFRGTEQVIGFCHKTSIAGW